VVTGVEGIKLGNGLGAAVDEGILVLGPVVVLPPAIPPKTFDVEEADFDLLASAKLVVPVPMPMDGAVEVVCCWEAEVLDANPMGGKLKPDLAFPAVVVLAPVVLEVAGTEAGVLLKMLLKDGGFKPEPVAEF